MNAVRVRAPPLPVQAFVMSAVVGQDGPAQRMGAGENVWIGSCASSVFLSRQNVVAKPSQFCRRGKGEIFVGV